MAASWVPATWVENGAVGREFQVTTDETAPRRHRRRRRRTDVSRPALGVHLDATYRELGGITAVCQHREQLPDRSDAGLVAAEHANDDDARGHPLGTFLATRDPWGLGVVGEVDLSNRPAFLQALRARAAARLEVHLDLRDLRFIDAGSLGAVGEIAAGLPDGGRLVLVPLRPRVRRLVELSPPGGTRAEIDP